MASASTSRSWQGLDAEAGALLEELGCDTGRGEHDEVADALRRAFEAGARAEREQAARAHFRLHLTREGADACTAMARAIRALPLPSPEREDPNR